MIKKSTEIIMVTLSILSCIATAIASFADSTLWTIIFGIAMIVFVVVYNVVCRRCPHCGHIAGRRGPFNLNDPGHCSFCGEKIEYKEDN